MLSKQARLSTKDFMIVMEKGRVVHSPLFLMRVLKQSRPNDMPARFAAVAPKKLAKTAVVRNKVRRQIYTAVRSHYNRVIRGADAILIAKEALVESTPEAIHRDLGDLFVKAGILK